MKKEFKLKVYKREKKLLIYIFFFLFGIYSLFKFIDSLNVDIKNKTIVNHLLKNSLYQEDTSTKNYIKSKITSIYKYPTSYLLTTKSNLIKEQEKTSPVIKEEKEEPLIYIYNTHQTEEYASSNFLEFTITPTVTMANYILEDIFNNNSYQTVVEEQSIKEVLNQNNWKYSYSYKASRIFLESVKTNYPSLKYFIDVHRDSLKKDRTTIVINEKSYAKLLFIVGMENPNATANLTFTEQINTCLNTKYPSLSKGIYKKSGAGVDGIYNQDFSPYVILIEIGGYENTTTEVLNSSIAFSECFLEVISTNESEGTS